MLDASLQINLAAFDVRHARHTLPHHLRIWGPQVREVLLVVDGQESPSRSREAGTQEGPSARELREVVEELEHPGLRVVDVDRSPAARAGVAAAFSARRVPDGDFRGRPYYQYLFGLAACAHPLVVHLDSDMLFGGGSRTWLQEAQEHMQRDETLVACNPLPGPPLADGQLRGQEGYAFEHVGPHAYRFANLSTRVFATDLPRMRRRLGSLDARRIPTLRSWAGSVRRRQVNWMTAEERISSAMQASRSGRLDFLGAGPGLWSVHPNERGEAFYAALPALIAHLEAGGTVPEPQLGHYDLDPSFLAAVGSS